MRQWCAEDHMPLMLVEGCGCTLRDQFGNEFIDGNASIWTNIHGHNHPVINAAIIEQLSKVAHTSFLGFTHEPAIRLAKELVDLVPGDKITRAFFTDNGSTAIESAVRMALQYWKQNGRPKRDTLVAFDRAYHGDTLGAASLGGIPLFKGSGNDFGYRVTTVATLDQLDSLTVDDRNRIAAVVIEPLIQGAAGMRLWPQGMLKALDGWCQSQDVFLILDEVMTGFGRTGKMFACEHYGLEPEIMTGGKGLSGGVGSLGLTAASDTVCKDFFGGTTPTSGGNAVSAAAGYAMIDVLLDEKLIENCAKMGRHFTEAAWALGDPWIGDVRFTGLLGGIELVKNKDTKEVLGKVELAKVKDMLHTEGMLITMSGWHGNVLRLQPPLSVTAGQIDQFLAALRKTLAGLRGA